MSADNWSDCPRCHARRVAEHEKAVEIVSTGYGKVPAKVWQEAKAAKKPEWSHVDGSEMREDYEFVLIEDGTLEIYYSGYCETCGLQLNYQHKERFVIGEDSEADNGE